MAKRDVVLYYLQVQNQYIEMLDNIKDLKEALDGKHIEQEQFEQAQKEIDIVKNNYERLSYILMLFNKPNRKNKQSKEESINSEWYNYLKGSSKEAIMDENKDALCDFKKLVKEIMDNGSK